MQIPWSWTLVPYVVVIHSGHHAHASKTIHDLEEAISALPPDDSKKKSGNALKIKERHGKEVFGLFKKCTITNNHQDFANFCLQPVPPFRRKTTSQ